jgi:hypothetical protein
VKTHGRPPEVQLFGDGDEATQVTHVHRYVPCMDRSGF